MRIHAFLTKPGTLGKYAIALFGQGILSAYHFGLNVFLVRNMDTSDYGLYAFSFVLAVLASSIGHALFSTPLSVYTPCMRWPARKLFIERLLGTLNFFLVLTVFISACMVGNITHQSQPSILAFSGFVALYVTRQYSRSFAFARRRPQIAILGDLLYLSVGIALFLFVFKLRGSATLTSTLAILAVANALATMLESKLLTSDVHVFLPWRSLRRYATIWKEVRWALLGATTSIMRSQAHSLLVTFLAGPGVYAPLAAGSVPFGPIRIGLLAWTGVMRPELAVAIADRQQAVLQRTLRLSLVFVTALLVAVAFLFFLFWEEIFQLLYAKQYGEQPMALIVSLWCAIALGSALATIPSGILQSFREFRMLALNSVVGFAMSFAFVSVSLLFFPPHFSLVGILLAEWYVAAYLLREALRRISCPW